MRTNKNKDYDPNKIEIVPISNIKNKYAGRLDADSDNESDEYGNIPTKKSRLNKNKKYAEDEDESVLSDTESNSNIKEDKIKLHKN